MECSAFVAVKGNTARYVAVRGNTMHDVLYKLVRENTDYYVAVTHSAILTSLGKHSAS